MNTPVPLPISKHIPAWKRLGLKLKNANDSAATATVTSEDTLNDAEDRSKLKRKSQEEETLAPTLAVNEPSKKKKKVRSTAPESNGITSVTPPSQRKKSVTFSPETKVEDGESVKQYHKNWVSSQRSNDPQFDVEKLNPALKALEPTTVRETSPEQPAVSLISPSLPIDNRPTAPKKKPKKKQNISHSNSGPTSQQPSSDYTYPALAYLTTYHTSRDSWKFNKADQNYLIKHIFHHAQVPAQHDPALASYLKGLASENTKARIRREALDIRAEDEKWLAIRDNIEQDSNGNDDKDMGVERETPEQRLARRLLDYNSAVDKVKAILEAKEDAREEAEWALGPARSEWEQRLERRRRAEVVLWGVGEIGEKVMEALQLATKNQQQQPETITSTAPKKLAEQPDFRKQMGPKRIRFDDDDDDDDKNKKPTVLELRTTVAPTILPPPITPKPTPNKPPSTSTTTNTTDQPKKRKRKVKSRPGAGAGAIPDDLTSSDSSSNSSDSDSDDQNEEVKRAIQRKRDLQERLAAQKRELERARREVEEVLSTSSDSDSSSGDSGSS